MFCMPRALLPSLDHREKPSPAVLSPFGVACGAQKMPWKGELIEALQADVLAYGLCGKELSSFLSGKGAVSSACGHGFDVDNE